MNISKLHTKILMLCLGTTLFALILQTILFEQTSSKMIYAQAKEESFHSLQNMQDDILNVMKSIENGLIDIYNEKDMIKDLKNEISIVQMRKKYYRRAYNIGVTNFDTSEAVLALYIYNTEHQIISTYRKAVTPKHNYPIDIYENAEKNNAEKVRKYVESDDSIMLVSSYYNESRGTDIVRFVLKLYQNNSLHKNIGYVICDVDSKVFRYIMEKYNVDSDMVMWLQPMEDRPIIVLGNTENEEYEDFKMLSESIGLGEQNKLNEAENSGRVFFQVSQEKYNLGAYSLMPRYLLNQNQKILTQNLFMIASFMIVMAAVLTYFVSGTLTKPLEEMTLTAKRIKSGETKLRMTVLKKDEIGQLGISFNEMLDQIEFLIGREYESKILLNRAQYNALQAQINPHFLYNTLDTMSSIAEIQDCEEVSHLCQSLSNMFRYSLDMKNPLSTLSKEILHLKNYIYVMNVRMQNQIRYEFSIEDDVLNDALPRISIQPLVENALNHGLKNKRGEKKIWIEAKKKERNLEIIVSDNGIGMTEERQKEILESTVREDEKTASIGLSNIHMRMKMLFGEDYGITIKSRMGEGTSVILIIPALTMEEMNEKKI